MRKLTMLQSEHNIPKLLNMSGIWDILIRSTAKYTDSYASDLLVDYETVMCYIRGYEGGERSFVFGMRTNGVDHASYVFKSVKEVRLYGKIYQLDVKPYSKDGFADYIEVSLWTIEYTYAEQYDNVPPTFA